MSGLELWIGLHGNPGWGNDLAPLLAPLRDGREQVRVELPTRPEEGAALSVLIDEIDRLIEEHAPARFRLVGYSWGGWLALTYLHHGKRRPDGVALIAPYLVAHSPISALAAMAVRAPWLGRLLLRRVACRAPAFLERVFAPEPLPPAVRDAAMALLGEPACWLGAVRYKRLMQREALPVLAQRPCRLLLVRGAEDRVGDWAVQRRPLVKLLDQGAIEQEVLEGAGHGLPWTRTAWLRDRLAAWAAADRQAAAHDGG